jgi:hypothetical protein
MSFSTGISGYSKRTRAFGVVFTAGRRRSTLVLVWCNLRYKAYQTKSPQLLEGFCGPDGTRTRPLSTVGMTGRHSLKNTIILELHDDIFRMLNKCTNSFDGSFFKHFFSFQCCRFSVKHFNIHQFPWDFIRRVRGFSIVVLCKSLGWVFRKPFVKAGIQLTLYDINVKGHKNKSLTFLRGFCGPDGTRTRDLRRDRAAF